jgi:hypothetical protein
MEHIARKAVVRLFFNRLTLSDNRQGGHGGAAEPPPTFRLADNTSNETAFQATAYFPNSTGLLFQLLGHIPILRQAQAC